MLVANAGVAKTMNCIFVPFFILISIQFFDAHFLNKSLVNYLNFGFTALVTLLFIPQTFTKKPRYFIVPVQLITLAIIVSFFMAVSFWKQSVTDTVIATIPLLLWPFFFYLDSVRFSVKLLEKIVLCLGAIYVVLYFYQFINSDTILFGKSLWGDEFIENRGIIRISFPGGGIFYLAVFISLNRIFATPNRKLINLIFVLAGVIIPVMQVTRVDVAGVLMIYAIHFLKGQSFPKKILIALTCLIFASYLSTSYTSITPVKGMVEAQKENVNEGEKYIRLVAGSYFFNDFSPSNVNRVLGNGVPYVDFSSYGRFVSILNDQQGFYLEDLGIISIYTLYGVLGVIAYLIIWFKSFTLKLPREFQYARYYLWFLLITSLTTSNLYSPNYLISTVIAVYIYQTAFTRKEEYTQSIKLLEASLRSQIPVQTANISSK